MQMAIRWRGASGRTRECTELTVEGDRGFESISLQRRVINEPHIAIKTYLSTGIRLAFSPGVRDASKLAMGGEEFIETLPPDLREDVADLP
jgi:hypothetical protein